MDISDLTVRVRYEWLDESMVRYEAVLPFRYLEKWAKNLLLRAGFETGTFELAIVCEEKLPIKRFLCITTRGRYEIVFSARLPDVMGAQCQCTFILRSKIFRTPEKIKRLASALTAEESFYQGSNIEETGVDINSDKLRAKR